MKKSLFLLAGAALMLAGFILLFRGIAQKRAGSTKQAPDTGTKLISQGSVATAAGGRALPRELDPAVNPYAGALREPGKEKRAWDAGFLAQFQSAATNDPVQFELTEGTLASGRIQMVQFRDGQPSYISGELTAPEPGKFFFLAPPAGGKAGKAVGVIEFPGSKTVFRIEPTGPNGAPELWRRHMDEVVCQSMPLLDPARAKDIAEIPPLRPDQVPDYAPDYNSNIVSLQSYPGAAGVLLLDFFGGYTPTWGGVTYPRPSVSNSQIKDLWKRVAEDYMPFNINVTTDVKVYLNAPAASRQKVVFTPNTSAMPSGAAGVAYIGSWNWGSDTVCWSIYTTGKAGGEVGSHEAGHTLGLGHQGTSTSGYFTGQGSGVTGWCAIMGAGYYQPVVTWAKGEYSDANNHEDELNIITTQNNSVTYRPDDTGSTLATSRYLEVNPGNTASAEGAIERTGDTDAFQFTTGGGVVSLTANPVGDWANLALSATLANSVDSIIASNNPQGSLSASIVLNIPAGTYTFRVTGIGRNSALTNGFSPYSSLGYYSISGTVAAPRLPTRLSVNEHAANGTLVGVVPALSTNSSFAYSINSGNTGGTFSIDNRGIVRVANNVLLDYNRLATNTMFPVQFQLLVNIADLSNPVLNETNRRVVISVLNINEPPSVTGFAASVLEHTRPGTPIGTLNVRSPDFSESLSYSIVAGDPQQRFAIDTAGTVLVAADLDASLQNQYSLTVAVNDNVVGNPLSSTGVVTVNIVTNRTLVRPGSISYALYDNIGSGTSVSDLTANARWPRDPTSELQMPSFEGTLNRADNFGAAMRGYLIPPQTGNYTFWIASDDSSELWISTTTNNAPLSRIAFVNGYTGWRQWTKYATQQSAPVSLVAGQGYYIEARMKEGGGGDHLSVAWRAPFTANQTNIISGLYLAPYFMNFVPHLTGSTVTLHQGAFTGAAITTLNLTDANAADTHFFSITSGNSAGLFTIDDSGTLRVADEAALLVAIPGTYVLQVSATDSGVPALSANTTVSANLVASNLITATSLRREIWNNIGGGTTVSALTNNAAYPRRPDQLESLSGFNSAIDVADNYGSRIRAYLNPTNSGAYRFFIASDDNSSLFLSTDIDPAHATRIAYVTNWTAANIWTTYSQQMSALVNLVAGQSYYIEALQKEGGGGDHLSVAWTGPGIVDGNGQPSTNIIDGSFLSLVDLNYPPQINSQTLPVFATVPNNTGIGRASPTDSPLDTLSFQIIDGNTNDMFAINSASGVITVVDNTLISNGAVTSFPLTVAVQDSGYNGLYASRTNQAVVTIAVQLPGNAFVWTGAENTNDWAAAGNWGGAVPADGARLTFGFPWQQSNHNDALNSVAWVQFTNGGFHLSGAPLSVQSGVTNRGDNSWDLDATLTGIQTWNNVNGTLTVGGAISNASTWNIVAASDFRVSGPVSGSGALSKSGTGRLIMQGDHSYSGTTVISSAGSTNALAVGDADLFIGNSDLTLNGRMDLGNHDATVGALNGSGSIFANDLTRTLTVGANDHSGTFGGSIQNNVTGSGITVNVVKTGLGTQTLSGANSYSGLTAVMAGVLNVLSSSALGSSDGGTMVKSGATLALANNVSIATESLTLNGAGFNGTGALRSDSGQNAFNGPIALGFASTINALAGRLTLGGQWNTAGNSSSLTFTTAPSAVISVTAGIPGGGALIKTGGGTLILNGTNTYMGTTTLTEGQITATSPRAFSWSSSITLAQGTILDLEALSVPMVISAGQTLQGDGTINGVVTVNGTLLPGRPLTIRGNTLLAGTTMLNISKDAGVRTNDLLVCNSSLTLGGVLTVSKQGLDTLIIGDTFKLFDAASFAGSFSAFNLPLLTSDLAWDVSHVNMDGTIRVELAAPPVLAFTISGQSLTLSWPNGYSSYELQSQTNSFGLGLNDNWQPVPGVTNNVISIPLDPANGSVFFRLAQP